MRRILLVDDDYGNRVTLGALLEGEGYRVDEAASLREASAKVSAGEVSYDLVLLDYHLGDGLGSALLPAVRERMPAAKVFLLSGSVTEEQVDQGLAVDAFLPKGLAFPDLLAHLDEGIDMSERAAVTEIHVLWISAGLSCDGDSVAITAATQPSIEDLIAGAIPGIPKVIFHHPLLAYEVGDHFMEVMHRAARGALDPFVLVVEGSIPNETLSGEGSWAALGVDEAGQPIPTCTWIDRLAPRALAVMGAGTCASYGGIHAMAGNPTGAMGLLDYLGPGFRSAAGIRIVNVPGCPVQPDSFMETLLYLLYQAAGLSPMIPLDDAGRPTWLFGQTVHEGCDRGGYYEQADFAAEYGERRCIVKLGCWGPVVLCNVPKRGWMAGIGGCPNVGGICIGCTMPGFPDKFMPFMDEPPGAKMSSSAVMMYGRTVRALRQFTQGSLDREPEWRRR